MRRESIVQTEPIDIFEHMRQKVEAEIALLQAETTKPVSEYQAKGQEELAGTAAVERLEGLELTTKHLNYIICWLQDDRELFDLVAQYLTRRIDYSSRRYRLGTIVLTIVTTVLSALAGWLTNLLGTPQQVLHILIH